MPLSVRQGGIIPLGPVMQYVDERPTEEIVLRIAPFAASGSAGFVVPANDEEIPVRYEANAAEHSVTIAPSRIRFRVEPCGARTRRRYGLRLHRVFGTERSTR